MSDYISLMRTFALVSTAKTDDEVHVLASPSDQFVWEELLQQDRTIILAEAGAGKTTEIQKQVETLNQKGNSAFFLRLEDIKDNFDLAFHSKLGTVSYTHLTLPTICSV